MDLDDNDLLYTNQYISSNDNNLTNEDIEKFKQFYINKTKQDNDLKLLQHTEEDDENFIDNSNKVNFENTNSILKSNRFIKNLHTTISVDSRDRIKSIYPYANNFNIFLGKSFKNVRKIELISLEFPNTDSVINSNNNMIYWRNKEDIDNDITITVKGVTQYPIYSASITYGSYTVSTLKNHIFSILNLVKRKQGYQNNVQVFNLNDFHFFVITLDINTDLVVFSSLIMKTLTTNPLSTTIGTGIITVNAPNHGYSTNDIIYIYNASQIAGIDADNINGFHEITVINSTYFTFSLNVQAASTVESGGGNKVQSGIKAPFQFLWGEQANTIAQNLGFPLENSSQLITTPILSGINIFQMIISFTDNLNFSKSYSFIGQTIQIGFVSLSVFYPQITFQITDVIDNKNILVLVNDNTIAQNLIDNFNQNNVMKFNTNLYDVSNYSNYSIPTFLVTTTENHNYQFDDIGIDIMLTNTEISYNGPNNDGTYQILQLPSTTEIILPGTLINDINNGDIPHHEPLTSWIVTIDQIDINYLFLNNKYYTKITTNVPHKLLENDSVMFHNIISSPSLLTKPYIIYSILSLNSFLIEFNANYVDPVLNNAYIGTGLLTISFPSHNFNNIIAVSNGPIYTVTSNYITVDTNTFSVSSVTTGTTLSGTVQSILIQTFNNHNFSINDIVRLTFLNDQPTMTSTSLTGGGYTIVSIPTNDTFIIINKSNAFNSLTYIPSSLEGYIGLNQNFYLYGANTIGDIDKSFINSIPFQVREIIDSTSFTFMCKGFATKIENGGGNTLYISSLIHGFDGIQSNTKNNSLNRSINLEGENYCFLTCPTLNTMLSTGKVNNIFARISLNQPPGYVCFTFLSNPKVFDIVPLNLLEELSFSVYNYDNTLYNFHDLDFSFTLRITESVDYTDLFNLSSKRGISDITTNL